MISLEKTSVPTGNYAKNKPQMCWRAMIVTRNSLQWKRRVRICSNKTIRACICEFHKKAPATVHIWNNTKWPTMKVVCAGSKDLNDHQYRKRQLRNPRRIVQAYSNMQTPFYW